MISHFTGTKAHLEPSTKAIHLQTTEEESARVSFLIAMYLARLALPLNCIHQYTYVNPLL